MKYSLLLTIFSSCWIASAQNDYTISHISVNDGLAHNNIYALFQDRHGYIWIGAGPNLHRYDGNQLLTFKHDIRNSNSLPDGDVRSIFEDSQNRFWIGTDGGGLVQFKNGVFTKIEAPNVPGNLQNSTIEHIIELPDSSVYLATWGDGIITYKNGSFTQIKHEPDNPNSLSSNNVVDLFYDEATDILWIGTWDGGLCYLHKNQIHRVSINEQGFNSSRARAITKSADGTIWIGSWGEGLFSFKDGKYTQYDSKHKYLDNDYVLAIQANGNQVWAGTWGGGITQVQNGKFKTYRRERNNINTIQSDFIESLTIDQSGTLWIGTFGGGITKMSTSRFTKLESLLPPTNRENTPTFIRSILEDDQGRIWIAGFEGIYIYDGSTLQNAKNVYPYFSDLLGINSIHQSDNGDIWFGGNTGVGLHVFDGKQVLDRSSWPGIDFKTYFIISITEKTDGTIMISVDMQGGLHFIKGDSITSWYHEPDNPNSLASGSVYFCKEVSDGTLWIGSSRYGLNSYKDGQFRHYSSNNKLEGSISNNYIYDLIESSDGTIWIGTAFGLNRYDKESDMFFHYLEADGLANHTVMSLQEDRQGNIWIGTQSGISRLNPETETFQNFDKNSGLQAHPFRRASTLYKKNANIIYMGGANGLIRFNPDSIINMPSDLNVKITNLRINNRIVAPGEDSILKDQIENTNSISFQRFNGTLSFEYSNMLFGGGPNYRYAYKLEGFDQDWQYVNQAQFAAYSNLPNGKYRFLVKTSSGGTEWGPEAELKVIVVPHWWETKWFVGLSIILSLSLVFGLIWLRFGFLSIQKQKLQQVVDEKTEDLKSAYRELKSLQEKRILGQEKERLTISREVHDGISQTLFGIRFMVNQSLKTQKNRETIEVPKDIDPLLDSVIQETRLILNNLGVSYLSKPTFKESLEDLIAKTERISTAKLVLAWEGHEHINNMLAGTNIFRIIQEAITNSIKHAKASNIYIQMKNHQQIICKITDDGIGFEFDELKYGFGLENMQIRANEIHGKLEIMSAPGKGTTVHISR